MADELNAPLGRKKPKIDLAAFGERFVNLPWARIMAGISLLLVVTIAGRVFFFTDPQGGRPSTTAPISTNINNNQIAQRAIEMQQGTENADGEMVAPTPSPQEMVNIAQNDNTGQQVEQGDTLAPLPDAPITNEFDLFPNMLESSKYGDIPRISAQGDTPFETYARPAISPQTASGKSLIAIIVTGLGLNTDATNDAIDRLPDAVTLAMAPYGPSLERTALNARRQGHELLLEIPMEPFDYPESDPGPHTLLSDQPARSNLDNLFWLMSRFGGYVGVINNLGARFSSSAVDFTPIMEELGTRGLGYVDDASSNRSLSFQLAAANKVPFGRATMTLDSNPSRAAILENLADLERRAQQQPGVIGIVSALPVSISTITSWAADLDEKNIELVPVSALMEAK